MKTFKSVEFIEELSNHLLIDAAYYGAFLDEVKDAARAAKSQEEFEVLMKPTYEKYPAIDIQWAGLLLQLLNLMLSKKLNEGKDNSEPEKTVN